MSEKTELIEFFFTADVHVPGLDDDLFDKVEAEFNKNEFAIEPGLGGIIPLEALLILFIVEDTSIYHVGDRAIGILDHTLFKAGIEDYELIRYGVAAPVSEGDEASVLEDDSPELVGVAGELPAGGFSESTNELEPAEILKLEDGGF